jgi:deoxyribodipyrimidine photo-lyase
MSTSARPVIVWLQQDLRLHDNEALCASAKAGPVIALFILDDATPGEWKLGGAQRWWLHHSLATLGTDFQKRGLTLVLRSGDPLTILQELVTETQAQGVFWNRRYEPAHIARDSAIKHTLKAQGLRVESFSSLLLFEPWQIKNKSGEYFKVFTPFWKSCLQHTPPRAPLPVPAMQPYAITLASDTLERWKMLPTHPDWAGGLRASWTPGETGALACAEHFFAHGLARYDDKRDFPAAACTSRLSPHLHFGELSTNALWHRCQSMQHTEESALRKPVSKFLAELGWREFSYHLLYHFPELPASSFRPAFNAFPWENDAALLHAWQKGRTGYPIVDAGMRELWQTGVMHNRVRMIAASFLTKHLLVHWTEGERWFWDTLVDADLASNSASWQWVAGSGADAAPYFRIFNPVLQGKKFDERGDYVRTFVPELARLSDDHIHTPWLADEGALARAGITLGKDYPFPIVDHDTARAKALAAYRRISGSADAGEKDA